MMATFDQTLWGDTGVGLPVGDGREKDVIIVDIFGDADSVEYSPFTGLRQWVPRQIAPPYKLLVWADPGLRDAFSRIKGVVEVDTGNLPQRYLIMVDPRYNLDWVKREIEGVAVTGAGEEERPDKKKEIDRADVMGGFLVPTKISVAMLKRNEANVRAGKKKKKKKKSKRGRE
ncbi:MAG: hypothetical protein FOGNACKC_00888 [Anaerolineae bacterium]|nr:hypothetical protein [Anaerolineae bacterium]